MDLLENRNVRIYKPIVVDVGGGYLMRGTRMDINSFSVVIIEHMHPNYGYFSDCMAWIKSFHIPEWKPIPAVKCWESITLKEFLYSHPYFKPLFE